MPQFSLRLLFVCVTLIAVGLAMGLRLLQLEYPYAVFNGETISLWIGSGTMIGAGALTPFRRTAKGALIGFVVQMLLLAAILLVGKMFVMPTV